MEKAEAAARLKRLIAKTLDFDETRIENNTRMVRDLGADSIDVAEVELEIEEAFDIDLPSETYGLHDMTVADYLSIVLKQVAVEG